MHWTVDLGSFLAGVVGGGAAAVAAVKLVVRSEFAGLMKLLDDRYYGREIGEERDKTMADRLALLEAGHSSGQTV